jgi:hypothetical protein
VGKVFITSVFINKGRRQCPRCLQSTAQITDTQVTIEWPQQQEPRIIRRPQLESTQRLDDFVKLVAEGGAVDASSIKAKLPHTERVAIIEGNDKMIAIAAKKIARAAYAEDLFKKSGYKLDRYYLAVNWVLDLDIKGFFDGLSHEWLVKFVEHRIADRRVVRLIQKWLNAGVLEDGKRTRVEEGTPQGGSASPLLANVYLHYVFDLWVQAWRQKRAHGDMIIVRFADDIVLGFQEKSDAEQFRVELTERMRKFNLELHPEKTRLLEFGPYAIDHRQWRGEGKPETFNFLGFTHICVKKRSNGRFTVLRQTIRKRLQAKLNQVKDELQRRMHEPIPELGKSVASGGAWAHPVLRRAHERTGAVAV